MTAYYNEHDPFAAAWLRELIKAGHNTALNTGGLAQPPSDRRAGTRASGEIETRPTTGRNAEGQTANECGELSAGFEGSGVELFGGLRAVASNTRLLQGHESDEQRLGPTNGFWRDADWLGCRDGKWRPVEPGTLPLAHGTAARVGRLCGYGNAINAEQAKIFIEAYLDTRDQFPVTQEVSFL